MTVLKKSFDTFESGIVFHHLPHFIIKIAYTGGSYLSTLPYYAGDSRIFDKIVIFSRINKPPAREPQNSRIQPIPPRREHSH